MKVNFADGIEILVDDEKLLSWEQAREKKKIVLMLEEGRGTVKYELDLETKSINKTN